MIRHFLQVRFAPVSAAKQTKPLYILRCHLSVLLDILTYCLIWMNRRSSVEIWMNPCCSRVVHVIPLLLSRCKYPSSFKHLNGLVSSATQHTATGVFCFSTVKPTEVIFLKYTHSYVVITQNNWFSLSSFHTCVTRVPPAITTTTTPFTLQTCSHASVHTKMHKHLCKVLFTRVCASLSHTHSLIASVSVLI